MKPKQKYDRANISPPGHDKIPAAEVLAYAQRIAEAMAEQHFKSDTPFEVYGDLWGVLSQIDNMASGMIRERKPIGECGNAAPLTPRPWAWMFHNKSGKPGERFGLCSQDGKKDVLLATDTADGRVVISIGEADADFLLAAVNSK